ncbi:MAG: ribosome biogenesis factor YjgA [bacterium]
MEEEKHDSEGRGRSAKKREAEEITRLAARAAELSDAVLASLALDEATMAALMQLRQTKSHGARKRALKYFAGKLRGDEEAREKLQVAMSQLDRAHHQVTAKHHELEKLRERLCSAEEQDAAMQEVVANYPSIDHKALLRLIKSVRHGNNKRAYREIFRRLREGVEGAESVEGPQE